MHTYGLLALFIFFLVPLTCSAKNSAGYILYCHGCSISQYNNKLNNIKTREENRATIIDFPNNHVKTFLITCSDGKKLLSRLFKSKAHSNNTCKNKQITLIDSPPYVKDIFDIYRNIWEKTNGTFRAEVVVDASSIWAKKINVSLDKHPLFTKGAFSTAAKPIARRRLADSLKAQFQYSVRTGQPIHEAEPFWSAFYCQKKYQNNPKAYALILSIHGRIKKFTSLHNNITYKVIWKNNTITYFKTSLFLDNFEPREHLDASGNNIPTNTQINNGMLGWAFAFETQDSAWAMIDYLRDFDLIDPDFRRGHVSVEKITFVQCINQGKYLCKHVNHL